MTSCLNARIKPVRHLQQCRVLHADIKPDNNLVNVSGERRHVCSVCMIPCCGLSRVVCRVWHLQQWRVLHADIKPDNILVNVSGNVHLLRV
jgi:serine/threonine protein kinase